MKSGLPLVIVAFLIAALIRASVGAAVVAMTMAAGIMAAMPGVAELSPVYLAAMVCAINGGATAFSHVNDSGFWLVGSFSMENRSLSDRRNVFRSTSAIIQHFPKSVNL